MAGVGHTAIMYDALLIQTGIETVLRRAVREPALDAITDRIVEHLRSQHSRHHRRRPPRARTTPAPKGCLRSWSGCRGVPRHEVRWSARACRRRAMTRFGPAEMRVSVATTA